MAAMQADVYALREINDEDAFQDLANSLKNIQAILYPITTIIPNSSLFGTQRCRSHFS